MIKRTLLPNDILKHFLKAGLCFACPCTMWGARAMTASRALMAYLRSADWLDRRCVLFSVAIQLTYPRKSA
jgi:hypothetical protein